AARHAAERRSGDVQDTHVGHFLIGKGRRAFEREVSFHRGLLKRLRGAFFSYSVAIYLGTIAALTIGLIALATLLVQGWGTSFAVALLALLPASEAAIGLTQWMVAAWVPPRRLPRLDLEREVPEEGQTMI